MNNLQGLVSLWRSREWCWSTRLPGLCSDFQIKRSQTAFSGWEAAEQRVGLIDALSAHNHRISLWQFQQLLTWEVMAGKYSQ